MTHCCRSTRPAFASVALVILWAFAPSANAEPLRVVASELPPCVFTDGEPSGFSIELWAALAAELNLEYQLDTLDFDGKLAAVRDGAADVAIGCISVSAARETELDFTHPVLASGLQAASLIESSLIPNFSDESLKMLLVLLIFVIFFAHLMWWSEQGQETISDRYFPGVFESVWFSLVTMSTVGYGDIAPRKWLGRVSAVLLILTGVTAFGVIFGQFAADAIGERAQNPVETVADLRTYKVGTKGGTATATFLDELGVETAHYSDLTAAADAMRDGEVDVVMHDSFAVIHLVHRSSDLQITGPTFAPHYIGIALQRDSELRERLNDALLKLQADGRFDSIKARWL